MVEVNIRSFIDFSESVVDFVCTPLIPVDSHAFLYVMDIFSEFMKMRPYKCLKVEWDICRY